MSSKLLKSQSPIFIWGRGEGFFEGSSESKTGKISKFHIFLGRGELFNCDPECEAAKIPKSHIYLSLWGKGGSLKVILSPKLVKCQGSISGLEGGGAWRERWWRCFRHLVRVWDDVKKFLTCRVPCYCAAVGYTLPRLRASQGSNLVWSQ